MCINIINIRLQSLKIAPFMSRKNSEFLIEATWHVRDRQFQIYEMRAGFYQNQ